MILTILNYWIRTRTRIVSEFLSVLQVQNAPEIHLSCRVRVVGQFLSSLILQKNKFVKSKTNT